VCETIDRRLYRRDYSSLLPEQRAVADRIAAFHARLAAGSAEWPSPGTPEQNATAREIYGVPYRALCPERRRAIDGLIPQRE
jgi:hypothetical protein